MKKKTYQQPEVKVVEIDSSDIICTSLIPQGRSNESYELEDESVTDGWFNI